MKLRYVKLIASDPAATLILTVSAVAPQSREHCAWWDVEEHHGSCWGWWHFY